MGKSTRALASGRAVDDHSQRPSYLKSEFLRGILLLFCMQLVSLALKLNHLFWECILVQKYLFKMLCTIKYSLSIPSVPGAALATETANQVNHSSPDLVLSTGRAPFSALNHPDGAADPPVRLKAQEQVRCPGVSPYKTAEQGSALRLYFVSTSPAWESGKKAHRSRGHYS